MNAKLVHALEFDGRKLTVFLPPSYTHSGKRYPAVYVHDGGKLMESCLNYMERLFREEILPELIVVGLGTDCRNDEYTPWPLDALAEGRPFFGGGGHAYIDEIADRIKPYVDGVYRTVPDAGRTGIIGGSLGGLVTLLAAYRRPDAFGCFGMLSPSLWYEGMLSFVDTNSVPPPGLRLYVSVGNREGFYKDNAQRQAVGNTLEIFRKWREKGFPEDRLRVNIEDGATHDFMFMARQFPEALRWLYGSSPASGDDAPANGAVVAHDDPHAGGDSLAGDAVRYAVPGTEVFDMRSGRTGLDYRIFVHVPVKPAPPSGYPVLYTVDGNAYFASMAEAMRLQTRHPRGLPSGMVVGIGYPGDEPFDSGRRFRDLTIPGIQEGLRPDGSPWPGNGGAEPFLDFIELELMPEIRRRYPVDDSRRALFGHSLGGFFTLYTLIARSPLFQTYVAGSPSFWWRDRVLFELLPALEERLRTGETRASLMIGIGVGEKEAMLEDAKLFFERMKRFEGASIRDLRHMTFEGEGHLSVLHPMISPMLRFVFAEDGVNLHV